MTQTLYATCDGQVLMPEGKVNLLPNQRCLIRIEVLAKQELKRKKKILQRLSARAIDLGISDLAEQHVTIIYMERKNDDKTDFC